MQTSTRIFPALLFGISMLAACKTGDGSSKNKKEMNATNTPVNGSFGYDLGFLQSKDDGLIVLKSMDEKAQVIVSPKYQGKVFTSTASGMEGKSFGWVNYKAFDEPVNDHMNAYGGEDRLWLGPEGGKYSLYFAPGTQMNFDNWHTPKGIDMESWNLVGEDEAKVSMQKELNLLNYAGTTLKIKLMREVRLLEKTRMEEMLSLSPGLPVNAVGFQTVNTMVNSGDQAWDESTGAPCLWSLDMFMPSPSCVIVIPYENNANGKVATTDYFGEIPKDRIKYENGVLFFKADGKSRGKLGIPPSRVKNVAGSYDAENKVLTITQFDIDKKGKYLNQEWRTDRAPFSGDAMNAYNDGPLENGSQMGPFYELESVSPAAFLQPNQKLVHHHSVFHFTGDETALDNIAQKVLGVSLKQIQDAFKNN